MGQRPPSQEANDDEQHQLLSSTPYPLRVSSRRSLIHNTRPGMRRKCATALCLMKRTKIEARSLPLHTAFCSHRPKLRGVQASRYFPAKPKLRIRTTAVHTLVFTFLEVCTCTPAGLSLYSGSYTSLSFFLAMISFRF